MLRVWLFRDIHITNGWHLHFYKVYYHQHQTAGTLKGVDSLEAKQADTVDAIILKRFQKT